VPKGCSKDSLLRQIKENFFSVTDESERAMFGVRLIHWVLRRPRSATMLRRKKRPRTRYFKYRDAVWSSDARCRVKQT
jgi:hypothetical protein